MPTTKGLHTSTSQLNLSRYLHRNNPQNAHLYTRITLKIATKRTPYPTASTYVELKSERV